MASLSAPNKPVSLFRLDAAGSDLLSLNAGQVTVDTEVDLSGTRARLVAGRFRTEEPPWAPHAKSLTGTDLTLSSELPFAVLLVPRPPWSGVTPVGTLAAVGR
jgi:hypothetical protein